MSWILLGAIIVAAAGAILVLWRRWIDPWRQVQELLNKIGEGERQSTFLIDGPQSARQVGLAFENIFDRQLKLVRQLAQQESGTTTVFTAMQDGLLVVDADRRVTLLNQAGQKLFGLTNLSIGVPLFETLRNPTIDRMIIEAMKSGAAVQGEVSPGDRQLEMNAVPTKNGKMVTGV